MNAKGIWVNKEYELTEEDLKSADFAICKYGSFLHKNVQKCYDNGVPFILFYENDPETMVEMGLNPNSWGDDHNKCLLDIVNGVQSGGVNIAVNGIMVDSSKVYMDTGGTITAQWIVQTGRHLLSRIRKLTGLKTFLYMNQNPIVAHSGSMESREALFAYINENDGVSTATFVGGLNEDGYPKDSDSPSLPYDGGNGWRFWLYNVNSNGVLDVVYYKPKEFLYEVLSYNQVQSEKPLEEVPPQGNLDFISRLTKVIDIAAEEWLKYK